MKKLYLIGAIFAVFFLVAGQAGAQSIRDYPSPLEACRFFASQGGFTITRNLEHDCTVRNGSKNAYIYTHFYDTGSNFCLEITSSIGRIYGPECMLISQTNRAQQAQPTNSSKIVTPPSFQIKELQYDHLPTGKPIKSGNNERIEITMPDGSLIQLDANATFTPVSNYEVQSVFGRYRYMWKPFHDGKCIVGQNLARQECRKIKTKDAILGVTGTEFLVDSNEAGTQVTVLEGSLSVADLNVKKTVEVIGGQTTYIKRGGLPTDPKAFDPAGIDRWWEKKTSSQIILDYVGIYFIILIILVIIVYITNRKKLTQIREKQVALLKGKEEAEINAVKSKYEPKISSLQKLIQSATLKQEKPATADKQGIATTSFIFGIICILPALSYFSILLSLPSVLAKILISPYELTNRLNSLPEHELLFIFAGIIGFILGLIGLKSSKKHLALLGIILSLTGFLLWLVIFSYLQG
jgi:hypothetical protein